MPKVVVRFLSRLISKFVFDFDTVYTLHRNQLYKQTNKMYFLCIYSTIFVQLYMFRRPFRSSSGVHDLLYLQLCTNHENVSNCPVLQLELVATVRPSS